MSEIATSSESKRRSRNQAPKGTQRRGVQLPEEIAVEIRRLKEEGVTIPNIASRLGIAMSTVSRYTSLKTDAPDAGRLRILRAVAEHGPVDANELIDLNPDLDGHTTVHLLYSLSRGGLVSFRESKSKTGGNGIEPERITATARGFAHLGMPAKPVNAALGDRHAPSIHPGDGSDYRNQPSVAPGGPVTHTWTTPEPKQSRPETIAVTPPPAPPAAVKRFDAMAKYPVVVDLSQRKGKLEAAAKLLEQAGQDELALAALAKVDDFTPLEREAIALLRAVIGYEPVIDGVPMGNEI